MAPCQNIGAIGSDKLAVSMSTVYLVSLRGGIGGSGCLQKLCKSTTWTASTSIRTKSPVKVTDKGLESHWAGTSNVVGLGFPTIDGVRSRLRGSY